MIAQKKLRFICVFLLAFTTSNMVATAKETIETVKAGIEVVKEGTAVARGVGELAKDFFIEPAVNFFSSKKIARLKVTVKILAGKNEILEGTVVSLKTLLAAAEAQSKIDAVKIAEEAAKYAALVSDIKWAIGIGVVGIVVIGGGLYAYHKYNKSIETAKTERKMKLLHVKQAVYKCLALNKNSAKDSEGIPLNCKEAMQAYLDAAGPVKYNNLKSAFLAR